MRNHILKNTVLHVSKNQAESAIQDIIQRWHLLMKGQPHLHGYVESVMSRKDLSEMQIETVRLTAEVWRKRLFDMALSLCAH